MALHGNYYRDMTSPDYFPLLDLQVGEYLPDVLGYAQGGIDVFVEVEEAVAFVSKVIRDEKVRNATNQFGLGENKL